ncbi:MAG: ABC transporter ATP-binding protein [SAR324 cluster bacterium]|nr:ABC transporter ATP-binding protein [SAR324 cluster bacterium]
MTEKLKIDSIKNIVELDGVEKHFGEIAALDGVSAQIREGEFFSLLGPSGCGKTTLLRLIAGFEQPTKGNIAIDGFQMHGVEANERPTNMVFQSYAIFPHLNVEENVGYGLKRLNLGKDETARRVNEMLKLVDLENYNKRPAHALSGGQRQRVALARSLIMKPKVLLLDEPLSSLDKNLREQMQLELRHLQRTVGITFILVTHDQEEALTMSDRIAVMFEGKIFQIASPQELYSRPKSKRVASFIGVMNFIEGQLLKDREQVTTVDVGILGNVNVNPDQIPIPLNPGPVIIGIRPEMLTLLFEDRDSTEYEISGVILESTYYGDMTYYNVQVNGLKSPLTISMRNTAGRRVLGVGESTRVGWGAESLVILKNSKV